MCSPRVLPDFAITEDIAIPRWIKAPPLPHRAEHPAQSWGRAEYRSGWVWCQLNAVGPAVPDVSGTAGPTNLAMWNPHAAALGAISDLPMLRLIGLCPERQSFNSSS